jgi:hypothetical protein
MIKYIIQFTGKETLSCVEVVVFKPGTNELRFL